VDDLLDLATLEEDLGLGAETALKLRRRAIEQAPTSIAARFALSRHLLLKDDAEGVAMMEAVVAEEPQACLAGAQLLRDYWWRRGDAKVASDWHARGVDCAAALHKTEQTRSRVTIHDQWAALGRGAHSVPRARLLRSAPAQLANRFAYRQCYWKLARKRRVTVRGVGPEPELGP
jgi:hypothetical protein